ncbi:MAG: hypothetical protein ACLQHF_04670 [Terracidiphilus sp.]
MTVVEAYRLKHQLGQSIAWGNSNLNALQIKELTKLTADDYARIRADYREWRVNVGLTITLVVLALGCVVANIYFTTTWVKIVAMVLGISFFYQLAKRDGHAEGYVDGYEAGHDEAIYKTLGIKPEEVAEMRKFAIDMEIDDMVVGRMNEREKAE